LRDVERLLIAVNVAGSVLAGARHEPIWFLASLLGFAVYVVLQDRALRRRIGARAWPSEGFARFNFNTNLYFSLRHLLLGALLFALAGNAASLVAA
jgi:hypothetical protein